MKKIILLILLSSAFSFAQQDFVIAGGNGSGSGGAVSFSLGQTAITELNGANGAMSQGVQQPIEIYTLSASSFVSDYEMNLFPNPTVHSITLTLSNSINFNQLSYEMYDVTGKQIQIGKITNSETVIDVSQLASSIYILKINESGTNVKTFKIIKK